MPSSMSGCSPFKKPVTTVRHLRGLTHWSSILVYELDWNLYQPDTVHCNLYILLALKISLHILVKVKKLTTNVLKSECRGHLTQIKIVSFLSYFVIFRKKNFYYIHFEIIIDPCNLTGSQHYNLFSNHTIFCSVRVLSSYVHLTKYEMNSS